jgi:ADP-ribose pyrophosphatase YjhB (NUDIX family)
VARIEYFEDPEAPKANRLIPAASGVVADDSGRVLLIRRTDNDLWTIPGGAMEPGEDIGACCRREVLEESGIEVEIVRLVGIYSNPRHVVEYSDGEVRQQFSVCFACRPAGGGLATSDESSDVGYFTPDEIEGKDIHPSIRLRIAHFHEARPDPVIA